MIHSIFKSSILSLFILSLLSTRISANQGRVDLKVIGEQGDAIPFADVYIAFENSSLLNMDRPGKKEINGKTNKIGKFSCSALTTGHIFIKITKEGYYYSSYKFDFAVSPDYIDQSGKKIPWIKPVEIILKKKENPVSMYVKKLTIEIPIVGKSIGFDFEAGDFVAPYGKGKITDLFFMFNGNFRSERDRDEKLTIFTSNSSDGLIKIIKERDDNSEFNFPKSAPVSGYEQRIEISKSTRLTETMHEDLETGYIFRVRSILDKDGKLIQANYGKIPGPLNFGYRADPNKGILIFTYYFNPGQSRSLEFDPSHNLFQKLKFEERVEKP
jgi:hypothetical protein